MTIELNEPLHVIGRRRATFQSLYPCALVYLDPGAGASPNSRSKDPSAYVRQAVGLNKSLLYAGLPRLTVYTNEVEAVRRMLADMADEDARPVVQALEIAHRDLPKSTPFYAAHFKFDLMIQAAKSLPKDALFLLLDTDMVAMHPLDAALITRCAWLGVGAFDISDQVFPAYGSARVIADLERVAGRPLGNPRWYGGEFLLCTTEFLTRLIERAMPCFTRYLAEIRHLHHHGDEAFISAALSLLEQEGQAIVDVGAYQAVGRHWPGNTHRNLYWFSRCSFLHLPGSKSVIEREARHRDFCPPRVWRVVAAQHRKGQLRWALKIMFDDRLKRRLRGIFSRFRRQKVDEGLEAAERDASGNA
ncbi:hypothetical protein [Trinickia sp. EG282A]|uniref:hypothetical protein n=1 Tax=Trinickia sp. EG282A TaxID=3237013 RepID=UPI0034D1E237